MMKTITACTHDCNDGCSLVVETGPDGSLKISGNPEHPITAGFTCAKIRRDPRRLSSPNRITEPRVRDGQSWKSVGWDEALDLIAAKIQAYRSEPSSILHVFGHGHKGVLTKKTDLFFSILGASKLGGALCDEAGIVACQRDFGVLDHNDIRDLVNARTIVNWGKDPARCAIHLQARIKKARTKGAKVITISPGGDDNRDLSDALIRIDPGADRFLAAAVCKLLIERGKALPQAAERSANWPAFEGLLAARSTAELIAASGVGEDDLETLYAVYAQDEPTATLIGWGLQRYAFGGENVRFINALAFVSGNIGVSGGGSYYGLSSVRNFNLDWAKAPGDDKRRTLLMPLIGDEILAADPPVKMIWVNGSNIVNQAPDCKTIGRAIKSAEFTVVVDAFLTDTAALADVILPCAVILEKEDIVGSVSHNFANYARPVVEPPGQARTDSWILEELGRRLDPPIELPSDEDCLKMSLASPFFDASLEELREKGFIQAKRPAVAFEGLEFAHPDGKYRFPEALNDQPAPPEGYPLRLMSLIRREAIHSHILPEDHPDTPTVYLAPDCPALNDIDPNKDVYLASPLGRLKVVVESLDGLHPGVAVYRRGDWMSLGGGINQLIEARLTDMGDGAAFYEQFCRLEN